MQEIDEVKVRKEKFQKLKEKGIDVSPYFYNYTHEITEIKETYEKYDDKHFENTKVEVSVPGRIVAKRVMGGASFFHISDGKNKLQIYAKKNILGNENYKTMKSLDIGDIIGVSGYLFRTRTGELTIVVENFKFLTKCFIPLPEKWHGLQDVELRYRKRYLDLIVNSEVREIFEKRFKIIREIRRFFDDKGYIEVETPMMHPIPGGALAKPFITHHNALNIDLYLRIAPELYLKRLVVGGFSKVYEINRNFRNEGISWQHNPEFTMLEFYEAYRDYNYLMEFTEELFKHLLDKGLIEEEIEFDDKKIKFKFPFKRIDYMEALEKYSPLGNEIKNEAKVIEHALSLAGGEEKLAPIYSKAIDYLFDEYVKPELVSPTFVINHPVEISPLSKKHRELEGRVERFELFVGGMEIANGFSELNDPDEQLERFKAQLKSREKGDDEAHRIDYDYIDALSYGLPPTAGEGIGIDRLIMIAVGRRSIKEVILFPLLRPKD